MQQLQHIEAIERRLWKAADTLRSNSELASNEYFLPVMGLIFLRHAYSRYLNVKVDIEKTLPSRGGKVRALTKEDFSGRGAIFLNKAAKFDNLVSLSDADDRAEAIINAMESIEKTFDELLKFIEELDDEDTRAVRENLNVETLVLFDMLRKPDLPKKEIDRIKKVASSLLEILKAEKLSIENWREKEATRDAVKQTIYDFLYDDKTGLPTDSYEEDDISVLTESLFNHVYRAYPEVPSPLYAPSFSLSR
jgi:type I restriction-modification system DNA methylase subunit